MTGKIKRLMGDKGYGFIEADGMDQDLFFHAKELIDVVFEELKEGDAVTFETAESPKGMNAIQVRRA